MHNYREKKTQNIKKVETQTPFNDQLSVICILPILAIAASLTFYCLKFSPFVTVNYILVLFILGGGTLLMGLVQECESLYKVLVAINFSSILNRLCIQSGL